MDIAKHTGLWVRAVASWLVGGDTPYAVRNIEGAAFIADTPRTFHTDFELLNDRGEVVCSLPWSLSPEGHADRERLKALLAG